VRGLEGERRAERTAQKAAAAEAGDGDAPDAKKRRRPFPNSTKAPPAALLMPLA